ncbi:multidrug resistance-associated protein 1-like [Ylistrum balloti]|uniref:multidrug resistance-associated protein 1-like n=1 Tax=Ylistrum balloti TaxID=509963 RepID=UPI002905BEDC|nr:multidrug resistance-associated protein 1-like [Ylistrum balloti]
MEEFCNGTFWDINETWNSSWPQFTECFQNTVLVWVPCGYVWLALPFYIWYLTSVIGQPLKCSWKHRIKLAIAVILIAFLVYWIVEVVNTLKPKEEYWRATLVGPIIHLATLCVVFVLMCLERWKGLVTSGVLFIYWVLVAVTFIIPFYSTIIQKAYEDHQTGFIIFMVSTGLVLIEVLVHCIAEELPNTDKFTCPEIQGSFLSRLSFTWLDKLMVMGYRKTLTEDDVFNLNPSEQSNEVVPRFERVWQSESAKQKIKARKSRVTKVPASSYENFTERTPLLSGTNINQDTKKDSSKDLVGKASLAKVLFKTFGLELLNAHIFKLFYDGLNFVNPFLLRLLIDFTVPDANGVYQQTWKGYVLTAGFFLTVLMQSFLFHQVFHKSTTLGLRVRAVLISAVYKKALTMSSASRKESTVGEIVNLMSVDTERIVSTLQYLWGIWSSPLQMAVALYFLYETTGPSMFAGFGSLILMFPANGYLMYKLQKLQEEQMKLKDDRIKVVTEVLNGIKILKLYAWEMSFKEKIAAVRKLELAVIWKAGIYNCGFMFSWTIAPYLVSLATFVTFIYASKDHFLDPQTAFVAISLFNILRFAVNIAPAVITEVVTANVSVKRLSKFLNSDDLDETCVTHNTSERDAVVIRDGEFLWDEEVGTTLSNINVRVPEGSLVAVVGQVGSGKSSLISAILGEMKKVKGEVNVKGSLSYIPQQAWIQNATLQDNILFGENLQQRRYDDIVDACALVSDMDMLPGGDQTEIGEKGINLSGGQKQRVSLARAVYFDSDIYLLDDPLSAVDSHVGKHIFDRVLGSNGLLKNKTRILITHGVQWLPHVDTIVVLDNGKVTEMGSYDELLSHAGAFAKFLQTYLLQNDEDSDQEEDPEVVETKAKILQRLTSINSDDGGELLRASESESGTEDKTLRRRKALSKEAAVEKKMEDKLIEEEKSETGSVKLAVFFAYARSLGILYSILIVLVSASYQALSVLGNMWLSKWTGDATLNNRTIGPPDSSVYMDKNSYYLGIYGGLGAGQAVFVTAFSVIVVVRAVRASRMLHSQMLHGILRSPMSFFDTTPVGRIINRFSQDMDIIDRELPLTFQMFLDCLFVVIGSLVVISYSTPFFMIIIVPVGFVYFLVQRFYIPTSRQLKRVESKTRSPIYNHFSETLSGVSVIRAYNVQHKFIAESEMRVDLNQKYSFASFSSNRWLGFRLEFLGNLIIVAASLLSVISRDGSGITGSIVGLSITYALQITENLNWMVRMSSELETKVVSVERVKEYSELQHEVTLVYKSHRPSLLWPAKGEVKFHKYSTRYRQGLDLVLKNIDVVIQPGEKVGIVGRTGAGKSSLTLALFRLIEPANGSIIIDGENLNRMGLHDCRSRLTILPQEPVLFSGSLRMNLDPLDNYMDSDLWNALEHAHLKTFVQSLPTGLEYDCGEGGQNLSVGQRQLVCLARSLLRKTKILVLDEATAAVDMETDDLIQQTIRTEFKDSTVLTIAHRLNTIMDYNRIMVLDKGEICEFDSPDNLLKDTSSVFYQLAKDAGII